VFFPWEVLLAGVAGIIGLVLVVLAARRSRVLQSKLTEYAARRPETSGRPPEVQVVFDEALARATAQPRDAQAIALALMPRVPDPDRENLVRLVFLTAALAQNMDPRAAITYTSKMWAQTRSIGDQSQPPAR
jgi:hypothetical protein